MEKYLKEEYGVVEVESVNHIIEYFEDCGYDYLPCGQGYYKDEATIICKAGDKFYNVTIKAEIGSSKQDRGDRLYWVEEIIGVKFEEIPKPQPKARMNTLIDLFDVTQEQLDEIYKFLDSKKIKYN